MEEAVKSAYTCGMGSKCRGDRKGCRCPTKGGRGVDGAEGEGGAGGGSGSAENSAENSAEPNLDESLSSTDCVVSS